MTEPIVSCARCADKGLVRVNFHSGEPFDIAVCACRRGQFLRSVDHAALRCWLAGPDAAPLPLEHRIGWLEDFEDEAPTVPARPDFAAAGKTKTARPKL